MASKKATQEEKQEAYKYLQQYKGQKLLAIVNSVSRSGMSRRVEFYGIGQEKQYQKNELTGDYEVASKIPCIDRIGWYMAKFCNWSYSVDKGGILVNGCGMDMIYHLLSSFNYCAMDEDGDIEGHKRRPNDRGYHNYFFDCSYQT